MEQDIKRQKFDSRKERNPERNMAKNVSTRSSSFCAVASSSNDSESVSTSPILDTAKIRRKGKLWTTRRAVSDSAFSPSLGKLTKGQEIQAIRSSTEKPVKLEHLSLHTEIKQCNRCDSLLNTDYQCKNCSPEKTTKSDCNIKNLADRLRELKRHKKSTARISSLKDAQITDEEFVKSARMLDKACNLIPPKKMPQSPKNHLGLLPFVELERLRLSQLQEERKSLPVSHLSLDEDKEEDGDMFADKESPDSAEDLEEFTPWNYKSTETSPSSFHGFSSQEYKNSREIAKKGSQVPKLDEIDEIFFFGFSPADIEESENRLQNWETKSLEIKGPNLKDTRDDKEEFLSSFKSKITQFSADTRKESTPEIESSEEIFNYKLKRKRAPENSSKIDVRCKKMATNIENTESSADCEKRQESREIITKAEVYSLPRINDIKHKSKNDSKADFLSEDIESIDDELLHNFESDNAVDLGRKCQVLNDSFPICLSKTNETKSEVKAEAETEAPLEIESIEDDLFAELDTVIDSGNKSELLKAKEKNERQNDQHLDNKLDTAKDSRISCGFSTAGGCPIRVSKNALEKAEIHLFKEIKSVEDEIIDELDNKIDSGTKSELSKADDRLLEEKERKKDQHFDGKLDTAKVSRISSGFSTAGGCPIRVSKNALEKAETQLFKEIKSIEDEIFDELDNKIGSGTKSELSKADDRLLEEKERKKDQNFDSKLDTAKGSRISSGFSTAGGCPIRVSKNALEKAEIHLFKEIKSVEDEIIDELDNKIDSGTKSELSKADDRLVEEKERKKDQHFDSKLDTAKVSRISSGFSTAGGCPIRVSKNALEKAETQLFKEIKSIEDEIIDELDNKIDSGTKSELSKADDRLLYEKERKKDQHFDSKLDTAKGSRISSGFSTAGGCPIRVSKNALEKAETQLFKEIKSIEDEIFDELDNKIDSGTKSELSKADDRLLEEKERKKDQHFDGKLDTAKVSRISSGFSTAGGCPIRVSKNALEKAETQLFKDIKNIEDEIIDELDNKIDSGTKSELSKADDRLLEEKERKKDQHFDGKLDTAKVSRISSGFSTAGGCSIRVSKNALEKAEIHLFKEIKSIEDEIFDELDNKIDSGTKSELSKAEAHLAKEIESTEDDIIDELNNKIDSRTKSELSKADVRLLDEKERKMDKLLDHKLDIVKDSPSSWGFSTAGGLPIRVSKTALQKAKTLLSEEIENLEDALFDESDSAIDSENKCVPQKPISLSKITSREIPTNSKEETIKSLGNDSKINFGFATAGGRELKVSEETWSKSKAAFDSIDVSSISDPAKIETPDNKIITNPKTMISGFSTASGCSKNVTTEAISTAEAQLSSDVDNIESLVFDDFVDPVEESDVSKKRKLEEIDEDTPLRRESSLKRKRGRYVNDLQARKLFIEDSNKEDEVEITKKAPEKNLIYEEEAIIAALLEDEERSNEGKTWQINALHSGGSISPELGCEIGNRSRADVSTRNSFGILNRDELEKVNANRGNEYSSCSRAISSGLGRDTEGNNHRAAGAERREEIQQESIPDDLTFDSQFSQDIQRSPVIDKFIADAMKIIEGRLAVALKQDEAIRGKRRIKIEQSDGFLYRLRNDNKESRTSWNELANGSAPSAREINWDSSGRDILSVTADSAINYSFRCADFYGEMNVRRNIEGIKVGDGAFLILDEKNCAGPREFERAFLASPGVDPNLVPTGWVRNHYRWIVWKLASMDRVKFGHKCLPRMLTPDRVMSELKYRYDREIYRTQWPPIRRILERGEDASVRLVLCVSNIIEVNDVNAPVQGAAHTPNLMGSTMYRMKVTDGWYSISTSIDAAMMNFIKTGKVREGTKLMIFGAKAMNLDQGCSVLEIPEAVTLRIYSNSTRRAKWNTKLDFYRANRGPMSFSLKSVKPNGGAICKLVVAVSRVYPILYREKLPDGQFVFRNARCDEEAARAHEARYQAKMEEIYANAWSEFQIGSMNRKGIGTTKNRSYTQEEAAACGRDMEEELRQRISSKMSECLPTPRDVTPVMKIRIAEDDTYALVTVWSTERDTTELFVEGSTIAIYNAFASGLRSRELQITAGRSTFVKREISRRISYPERIYTSLSDVMELGFNPIYGEFDTIGIVSSTGPAPHGMKNFETVNLACPKPGDTDASDFLSVLFWQGVSAHGYAKILTVGSLVACSNLEWRRNTSRSIPTAYCTERSVFSKNPRQNHLVQAFESLRNEIKEPQVYAAACAAVIEEEIAKKSALRTPGSSGTPYRPATSNNRTPGWSPRDLAIDATCTTPKIDSRKISTRKRLERLEVYGEPPKLPSIVINNSSRKVSSAFRSPVLTPVTKS